MKPSAATFGVVVKATGTTGAPTPPEVMVTGACDGVTVK